MQKLSKKEIKKIRAKPDKINWDSINYYFLSEDFIREFQDRLCWNKICLFQELSEDFMREFSDKVRWEHISYFQNLSEDFIREFKDEVDWGAISWCSTNLSKEFYMEFYDRIDWNMLDRKSKLYKGYFDNALNHVKLHICLNYRQLNKYL